MEKTCSQKLSLILPGYKKILICPSVRYLLHSHSGGQEDSSKCRDVLAEKASVRPEGDQSWTSFQMEQIHPGRAQGQLQEASVQRCNL